ncbi:LysR substrate-binding domain-containing protein [Microbulbifer hainanensis]|uniref:LysR substrate-binding domain-containing protein n=1 Tax=Microbulbifer hainanensis TaxID=2735675 RepID=UPI00186905BC|nr:LysR substrate-binding domain-containing protein [Microbulbifer hainanensis]
MMDLNDLRYFALIVEHGGFTAAEQVAHVHRSKLSRRVAQLEERLGVRLLQRSTRSLALTEAGQAFYEHCAAMLIEADAAVEAIAQMRSEPVGTVRLSCPVAMAQLYIARLLAEFMVAHPKVRVELDSNDRNINLIEERVDIAVRARDSALQQPGLVARRIASGRFILAASPAFFDSAGQIDSPEKLAECDTLGGLAGGEKQIWSLVTADGHSARVEHRPRLLCSDLSVQYEAAISGVGIALLPERIASRGLKYGALVRVLPEWSTPEEDVHILFASRRGMLPSVRSLVDFLVERLPAALQS